MILVLIVVLAIIGCAIVAIGAVAAIAFDVRHRLPRRPRQDSVARYDRVERQLEPSCTHRAPAVPVWTEFEDPPRLVRALCPLCLEEVPTTRLTPRQREPGWPVRRELTVPELLGLTPETARQRFRELADQITDGDFDVTEAQVAELEALKAVIEAEEEVPIFDGGSAEPVDIIRIPGRLTEAQAADIKARFTTANEHRSLVLDEQTETITWFTNMRAYVEEAAASASILRKNRPTSPYHHRSDL